MANRSVAFTCASVDVAASSTLVLAALDPNQVSYVCFQNDDEAAYMYLKPRAAAALHQGICLAPKQAFEMSRELGNLESGPWYGIHDGSGTKVLLITKGV